MQENLGERIARIRRERGLTQSQLAERLYVTPQAVSKWERGLSLPDAEMLGKIARALDRGTDELLGLSAARPSARPSPSRPVSRAERRGSTPLSYYVLCGALGLYFLVFFVGVIAGLSMTAALEVFLFLPFPVALISFLLCKERRFSGWLRRAVLIVQAGYFVLHMILFRTSVPWLNFVVFVWDTLFLLSVLFGFEYRRGYGVPLYRASSFWISVRHGAVRGLRDLERLHGGGRDRCFRGLCPGHGGGALLHDPAAGAHLQDRDQNGALIRRGGRRGRPRTESEKIRTEYCRTCMMQDFRTF